MLNSFAVGVDIGGSHITAALVNLKTGNIVSNSLVRKSVNAHASSEDLIKEWTQVISAIFLNLENIDSNEKKIIGIAIPGPFDYEKGISLIKGQNKFDALYGLNVVDLLSQSLGIPNQNIQLLNDAACFLGGEVFGGSAKGFNHAIGLTLGTGLGSARYHNGVAEDAALWAAPFRNGITEDYLSTKWFLETYKKNSGKTVKDVKALALFASEDKEASMLFATFGDILGEFLVSFVESDNPEVIVLGGNIIKASDLFFPAMELSLKSAGVHIPIKKAMLGEEAALIGAASCWKSKI